MTEFFDQKLTLDASREEGWKKMFENWSKKFPEKRKEFDFMHQSKLPADIEEKLTQLPLKGPMAGRKASQDVTNFLADMLPQLYGGSADLLVLIIPTSKNIL